MDKATAYDSRIGLRKVGFTLVELLVVVSIIALLISILLPSLSKAREQARRIKCGVQLRTLGMGMTLWQQDNRGFLPPRCREGMGCGKRSVPVAIRRGALSKIPYASAPDNPIGVVGNPTQNQNATDATLTEPTSYNSATGFPLNPYVVPNWKLGVDFEVTKCPSDVRTMEAVDAKVKGFTKGSIGSSFELNGTSYLTNIETYFPWRGHGAWMMPVEVASNRRLGPNFNGDLIYRASNYVVMMDLANFLENFDAGHGSLGGRTIVGRWHESKTGERYENANALFADAHVSFGKYDMPKIAGGLANLGPFVNATWSLYPYKRRAEDTLRDAP